MSSMQENNFEGQAHRIMEEFALTPSEKVWEKVQADITGQKKSRLGMLPAALLICVFLLTTFLLHDLEKKHGVTYPPISENKNSIIEEPTATTSSNLSKTQTGVVTLKNKTLAGNDKPGLNKGSLNQTSRLSASTKNQ